MRVFFRQPEGDVRDHHAERERFDPDFFVGIFPFGIQKTQNIRMVRMEINRAGPLARAKLVGIRKRVFQHFHHRDHAGRLILNAFDRRARLAQIGE
ncbi:Uncharacterised protein [Salmonella enterica subsp. enterica serovar Typhi]|nr:Uncharacterised protein [Salmonella enterica subsp. enterica serovar Typhi]